MDGAIGEAGRQAHLPCPALLGRHRHTPIGTAAEREACESE